MNKQMLASENLLVAEAIDTGTFRGGGRLLFGSSAARGCSAAGKNLKQSRTPRAPPLPNVLVRIDPTAVTRSDGQHILVERALQK